MPHIRAIALRLALTLLAVAGALAVAEYAMRFVYRHARSSGNSGDFIARRGGGPPIVTNHLGFREREIPPRSPDRYRIVVVGDSFTWGQGIEAGQRFSNLIEAALGPRYEVLNFGRPGNDMPEHLDVLGQALTVSPDFILLQLYINDFETKQMQRPRPHPLLPSPLDENLEQSSVLYDVMSRQWASLQSAFGIVDSYPEYMVRNLRDPDSPNSRLAFGMLRQFMERCHQAGVACGTVLFPAPDAMGPNGSNYPFGFLHDRVRETCASEHTPCLDLLPPFSTIRDPRSMWVSPFDAHPNALANERASREILQRFAPLWRG